MESASEHSPGIAVEIQFTTGRYHANPWGRNVNEGAVEWPPSPWRFLRALVAVWRADGSSDEPVIRSLLSKLSTPPSFQLAPITTGHLRHYVPHGEESRLMLDPFVVCQKAITIAWPGELMGEEEAALDALLSKLTYLGRAESWCRATRVSSPNSSPQTRPIGPEESYGGQTVTLLCAEPSVILEQLEITTGEMRRKRLNRPHGSKWVTFASEGISDPSGTTPEPRPQLAMFIVRSAKPIAVEQTLRLADRVRDELLRLHGNVHSPIFGGKISGAVREDNHRHLHVLPEGGGESIERVLLWTPDGFGPGEVEVLRKLSTIPAQGRQEQLQLLPWSLLDQHGDEVFGRAKSWRSSTPYLPARHPKTNGRDSVLDQIIRECELRGLPQPIITSISPAPEGYVTHRHGQPKAIGPAQLVELGFPAPIPGPLLLGANSHFGMGRFAPSKESPTSAPISP